MPIETKIQAAHFLSLLARLILLGASCGLVLYVAYMRHQYHQKRKRRWIV